MPFALANDRRKRKRGTRPPCRVFLWPKKMCQMCCKIKTLSYIWHMSNAQHNNIMAYKNHTQPIGYINDRLNETTCDGAFKATQLAAWVVDPNRPTDRGTHPEFLPARLTKTDALDCPVGSIVCYQKTISGFETMEGRDFVDITQLVDETASTVYMRKVQPFEAGPVIWAHVPNHKIERAGGDPYAVQFVWVARWGQYTHAFV